MPPTLFVKLLSTKAVPPTKGTEYSAGHDLYASEETVVPAGGKAMVSTDISIAIPVDTYARVAPRSGLTWKNSIDVGAGVIDYDYRGEVKVILFNHGTEDFTVTAGSRIAQLILESIVNAPVQVVEDLPESDRGDGGFGSTGV